MALSASDDRATIFALAGPEIEATPPELLRATPWDGQIGSSYSTFSASTAAVPQVPTLKFIGYHVYDNVLQAQGFTTLTLEPSRQGSVVANEWQTWTVTGDSEVWQSNTSDGFCVRAAPCTVAEFAAQYPDGAWGQTQIALGAFPPGGAAEVAYVDDVTIVAGTDSFGYDFEAPEDSASTATITKGAATATGGTVDLRLEASDAAALGATEFTITLTNGGTATPTVITVPAGETDTSSLPVGFGTTTVTVTANGATIASSEVTFAAPTTKPTPTPTPSPSEPFVPGPGATGDSSGLGVPTGLVTAAVLAAVGIGATLALRTRRGTHS